MVRAVSLFLGLVMLVQVIRPIGVPGLRRRADAWKIAVLAMAITGLVTLIRPE